MPSGDRWLRRVRAIWILGGLSASQALVVSVALALEGQVITEQDGTPVGNAEVSVIGRTQTARTDPDGRFSLIPDPHPPFELLVVLPGGRYTRPILVQKIPAEGVIVVKVTPVIMDTVRVTPGAAPGIQTTPASGTTLVSRSDIQTRQPQSLSQALETTAGLSNVSEGQASVPAIRGLAQARSLILIDGARVTAERRIGPSATYLDPFILESVEVSRGPGSVAYGSDALGGVIHARTRRPRPGGDLAFVLSGAIGTGVPQARAGLEVESGIGERSGMLFSAHQRSFSDYDSPEGEVFNSGARDRGFLARYAHALDHGVLSLGFQGDYGRDIERPRTNSESVRFYNPREDSNRFTASYESGPALGLDSTELSLFLGGYRVVTDQDQFPTESKARQIARADVSAKDLGVRAVASEHWGQTRLDFGLDINGRFDLEAEDVVVDFDLAGQKTEVDTFQTIESARRIDYGVFVTAEGAVSPVVSLSAGLRFDRVESKNEGGFFGDLSKTHSEPSGYAAMTLGSFSGFSVSLQVSRGFRDARLSDRYFRGVTGAGFITGNPDLEPETSEQYDLALRHTRGRWRSAFYFYDYRIQDLIERFEDETQPDFFFFRNRGSAWIRGVEVETQADLAARVTLQIAASIADGQSRDDGAPLDDIQPESLSVQVRKEIGEHGFVQLRGAYRGEHDEPGPNEVTIDAYTLVDLAAGWKVTRNVELQLLGRNLFDESYALSTDRRSPVAPGIAGILSARVTF